VGRKGNIKKENKSKQTIFFSINWLIKEATPTQATQKKNNRKGKKSNLYSGLFWTKQSPQLL